MKQRGGLITSLTTFAVFVLLEAASIVMMTNNGIVQRLKVMGGVRSVQAFFWDKNEKLRHYFDYRTENEKLLEENLALRKEISRYETFIADNDSLVALSIPEYDFIRARVIKSSVDRQNNYILLDRGKMHGVKPGMGVISDRGIIGIVNAVGERYSQVISFLSTRQTISAKVASNGAFGPMVWTGTGNFRAVIHEFSIHAETHPGDTVVSSGFSSIYPPDIPIGTVLSTEVINGSSLDVTVQMFEDYGAIRDVYVVCNNRIEEINELTPPTR